MDSYHSILDITVMHKLLVGKQGYVNMDAYEPSTLMYILLKLHTYFDTKRLQNA
jgi:hypothetical protein